MAFPEKETDDAEATRSLTRRFRNADELREELDRNLLVGSVWIPLGDTDPRPATRDDVEVHLVLPDGRVIDALKGRVACVAPGGIAVFIDKLAPEVLAMLVEDHPEEPAFPRQQDAVAPPEPLPLPAEPTLASAFATSSAEDPDVTRPAPVAIPREDPEQTRRSRAVTIEPPAEIDPTDAPPLPWGLGIPEPSVAPDAKTPPSGIPAVAAPQQESYFAPNDRWIEEPSIEVPAAIGDRPTPAIESALPIAEEPAETPAEYPAARGAPDVVATAADDGDPLTSEDERSHDPVESAVGYASLMSAIEPTLGRRGEPASEPEVEEVPPDPSAEYPALRRPADLDPVPAVVLLGDVGAWAEPEAGWDVGLPAAKLAPEMGFVAPAADSAPTALSPVTDAPPVAAELAEPEAPPTPPEAAAAPAAEAAPIPVKNAQGRFELLFPFATLGDFKKEYDVNIRRGGVLVPTPTPPPIRSAVDVVFSLMNGKREVRLRGEVVFHTPGGAGIQLSELPAPLKQEIDGLLAAASVVAPQTPPPAPVAPAAPMRVPTPSRAMGPGASPSPAVAASVASTERVAPATAPVETGSDSMRAAPTPAGERFEGDLVEVLREAEVEGEARIEGQVGGRASWLKVLATLQTQKATGVLSAARKGETKLFLLYQGRLVDGVGQPPRHDETLYNVARKQQLLKGGSLRVLEKALDGTKDEYDGASGAGVWSPQELDKARRWQLLERCADVFGWERGRYKFDPTGDRAWARPTSGVPVGHVILHGVRSYIRASGEDLARVMRPALDRVVMIVPATGFEPGRVGMSDKEMRFWSDIDGNKPLRALLQTTPIPVSQTYRIVFALCRLGVLALGGGPTQRAKEEPADVLRRRIEDLRTRDPFGKIGLSWMASGQQIQQAWDQLRNELLQPMRAGGELAELAKQIFGTCEIAFKQISDERTRRVLRLKLLEDPSRIEASADMLAEKADILHLRGDLDGAVSTIQMAIDLSPSNEAFRKLAARFSQER